MQFNATSLIPGSTYNVKVAASTGGGMGEFTSLLSVKTLYTGMLSVAFSAVWKMWNNACKNLGLSYQFNNKNKGQKLHIYNSLKTI